MIGMGHMIRYQLIRVITAGAICLLSLATAGSHASDLVLYTYHNKPPYYYSETEGEAPQGIYTDLVSQLNRIQSDYKISIQYVSRPRINLMMAENTLKGGLIGVFPIWFDDAQQKKYLWTKGFMGDTDYVVARKGSAFVYSHPRDLEGKQGAVVRGLYYWGISERVKNGSIKIYETSSEFQNLKMLGRGRVDFTVLGELTGAYFMQKHLSEIEFEFLAIPHDTFTRHIMFPKDKEGAFKTIDTELRKLMQDGVWQVSLNLTRGPLKDFIRTHVR